MQFASFSTAGMARNLPKQANHSKPAKANGLVLKWAFSAPAQCEITMVAGWKWIGSGLPLIPKGEQPHITLDLSRNDTKKQIIFN